MANLQADSPAKPIEEKKEERVFRFTVFPPSYEIRGYDTQDTLILLKKTWWLYLLMLIALICILLIIIYLKDGFAVLAVSAISTWVKSKLQ
ncbi:MAG: hypothetical protein LCH81_05710 [Bacteroidetes bacterium]|nr:hypothetical protein [Bacteroidota bacterium]